MDMDQDVSVLFEKQYKNKRNVSGKEKLDIFGIQINKLTWKSRKPYTKRTWNCRLIYLCERWGFQIKLSLRIIGKGLRENDCDE